MRTSPIRVLLADDTPEIRVLLRATLDSDGRFVVTGEAADGVQAIDLVREHSPDAVILDLAMPVMDGLQAIPHIREQAPDIRILVLSGFDSSQMAEEAVKLGADAYFEKGRSLDEVIDALIEFYPGAEVEASVSGAGAEPSLSGAGAEPSVSGAGADPFVFEPAAEIEQQRPTEEPVAQPGALEDLERADLADHRIDVMLSTLIHELQTPVTVIRGFASALQNAVASMDERSIAAGAAAIERSAGNLQALIRSLADVRAIDAGRLELTREVTEVSSMVAETLKDLSVITDPHPVAYNAEEPIHADVDPTRIRQVLTNLMSNAAKFSPDHQPIEVSVERADDGSVRLAVSDHGPGIPKERMKLLFRKFSRLGTSAPGTGLGLYVSRGIVRAHGGEITVRSGPEGGCRFEVQLLTADR